jgi:hypothetical protein
MVALRSSGEAPAQFAFDLALLGQAANLVAFVVSGASPWLERGVPALTAAIQAQAMRELPSSFGAPVIVHTAVERRATFACTPRLQRPAADVAARLVAAGDYVAGPYPATLEGATRAGVRAAKLAL